MSVPGIQGPQVEVSVVDYRISKVVELYPWQRFYVVIEYGGRRYKKEGLNQTTTENFAIELIEGSSEMDIYVLKGSTEIFIGAGKFLVPQVSEESILPVILNTTSGRCIGEVVLLVKYSKAIGSNASVIIDRPSILEESRGMKESLRPSNASPRGRNNLEVIKKLNVKSLRPSNESGIMDRPSTVEESRGMKESLRPSNAGPRETNNLEVIKKLNDVKISKENNIGSFKPSRGFLGELEKNTPKQFSPDELRTFTSGFAVKAGSGGFGTVYKGQFRGGENIAVKVLEENGLAEKSFEAEVSTMFKTSHRNLVRFYGYCFDHNMKAIVYEYMENGSLDAVLYGNPRKLEWQKFYKISIEMAKGLAYLHDGCDRQIVHHDLKPANVLLDKALSAKITDFGLARLIDKDVTHVTWTNCGGTIGYMAPEIFMQASKITSKCDVYSFGMILFEVLRMKRNNEGSVWFPKQVWLKFDNGELDELFDDCGIPKEDRTRAKMLCMVALWCAQFLSDARPSMSKVVMMLEGQIPIEKPPNPRFS